MKLRNTLRTLLATLLLATLSPLFSPAQTVITDDFTDPSKWGPSEASPGKDILVTNGVMAFTSTTLADGFAAIPRKGPILPTTSDWSLKIDVHIDPSPATAAGQYTDVFLGFGKTGDEFNTHVTFEFDRADNYYDIGDDVRINGVDTAGLFNHAGYSSPDASLRMDYSSGNHTITYYCDVDGTNNGYFWGWARGVANLATGPYDLKLSPTDTFTILVVGSSSKQVVAPGQAFLRNLEITMWPLPFTYTTNNGTITITGYLGFGGAVTIPSTINDLPVTAIGDRAFYQCHSLSSVTISSGVTTIGSEAFAECTFLTNVTLPNSVTNIGNAAFSICWNLFGVTIPNSVLTIEDNAFASCISLTHIAIPKSVTHIGLGVFAACDYLDSIVVDPLNSTYSSIDGVLFNHSQTALIGYPPGRAATYIVPSGVTRIEDGAFNGSTLLTNVALPNGVTSIGASAFSGCINLADVSLPNGLTNIGAWAFASCDGLTNLTIPQSVTSIGDYAFWYASRLEGVYFQGDAPTLTWLVFDPTSTALVYYLPATSGWGPTFGIRPTVPWDPTVQTSSPDFGVQNNQFGFTITGTANIPIVVEASTNLLNPSWVPLQTCTLTNGSLYFTDPNWTNYPSRLYRLRSP